MINIIITIPCGIRKVFFNKQISDLHTIQSSKNIIHNVVISIHFHFDISQTVKSIFLVSAKDRKY